MHFSPISLLFSKINARNINYMAVLNFRKCLDLRKNCYNPTASYAYKDKHTGGKCEAGF
ncbi:hypothetical protein JCM39068_18010 [Desulfocastanea catecholica]